MIGRAELTVRCAQESADFLRFFEPGAAGEMQVLVRVPSETENVWLTENDARRLFNWLGARLVKWPRT